MIKFRSLKIKLIFMVSLLLMLTISGIASFMYMDTLKRIEEGLGRRAMGIARTAAIAVDDDKHQMISRNIVAAF